MRNLDWKRYRFDFCCLSGLPGELDGEIRSLGGVVHLIPLGILFPGRFRKLLRNGGFHAVHSHVHWFSGYILRLAAKEGVPQRICQFASTWDGKRAHLLRRLRNRIFKRWVELHATDIVGVSEGALSANLGPEWSHDARCRVIYRGIDVSRFRIRPDRTGIRAELGIPQDAVVVIHVGRMDPPKNHERLLCIFERFVRMVPGAYLLLIGAVRDPIESSVRRIVERMAISERVVFAGVRADVPRLLRASDLMIFPSLWEGLPGAVLEAVAAGLPVLASDLPGINEIARYLPGVRTMSLELSDEKWAIAALDFQSYRDPGIRTEEAFSKSPFSMGHALASSEQLYLCASIASWNRG
ncbi:MAG: glycosyltransferase [Candidatus Korobacteraceae bacterium]